MAAVTEFRILGPLEVVNAAGLPIPVSGSRERGLLALLALSANRVVSSDRLITDLWGAGTSEGSRHALRVCVSRLRRTLRDSGADDILATQAPGYVLRIDDDAVDAARFQRLLGDARAVAAHGDDARAAMLLRQALALWRGDALADVSVAHADAVRLEEARLGAIEERVAADLACGRHAELAGELEQLTASHPLRERFWQLRMLALYRSGRQAEALRTYQALRRVLGDELGLEPSPDSARMESAIVRHDTSLDWAPQSAPTRPAVIGQTERPSAHELPVPHRTRYATSDGVKIAYQVLGEGPLDIVVVPGFVSNLDLYWENPGWQRIFERFATLGRVILYDKRGTGLSDPVQRVPTLDQRADDLMAVMDAVESRQAALFGISEGGPLSILLAATHPERVRCLLLYGATPRFMSGPEWRFGWSASRVDEVLEDVEQHWGDGALLDVFAPSEIGNDVVRQAWDRVQRAGASPAMARAVMESMVATDCRDVLPAIKQPTLILQRRGDRCAFADAARYMAERISNSRYVELEGDNHLITAGDLDPILGEVEAFLAQFGDGADVETAGTKPDRVVAAVLFLELQRPPGEPNDRALVATLEHAGARQVISGEDGTFAIFAAPSRALASAGAIQARTAAAGCHARAGVHVGECDVPTHDTKGLVFRVAAGLANRAKFGQILLTATVKDLIATPDPAVVSHGTVSIADVPGDWIVFALGQHNTPTATR